MNFPIAHAFAHVALLAMAASAAGQTPPRAMRADPLDSQAVVPATAYKPALAPYRRLRDEPPVAWRGANDTVHGIGGWRAYARDAQASPPASAASAPRAP